MGEVAGPDTLHHSYRRASPLEIRRVSNAGCFRLHCDQIFLSQALNGEEIDLELVADNLWKTLYYDALLGRFDERTKAITGAPSLR